jgi:hypothetical protein
LKGLTLTDFVIASLDRSAREAVREHETMTLNALLIGRLARDLSFPGLGGILLADALARGARQAEEIGASLIVVEAKDAAAKRFYEKHGFQAMESHPARLVLPMRTARSLLST